MVFAPDSDGRNASSSSGEDGASVYLLNVSVPAADQ